MKDPFNVKISKKKFINEIKGCETITLKDFKKEIISQSFDEKTGEYTTILKIEGHFNATIKKSN